MHITRLDPHLRVASSILKDICDPISMKTHINDIGLDHMRKGFRDNMIVNDMNSCIVIFDRLNVRGVGNSMDAPNKHLKSETRVECARVVERGKASGSGGGVFGDLDSGLATDWWR